MHSKQKESSRLKSLSLLTLIAAHSLKNYAIDELRTLTSARGSTGGPWISTKGRRLTIEELFKCQGFTPDAYKYREADVSERQMGLMFGNTMTLPVVGAVLEKALVAAGLVARDKPNPIFVSPLS